MKRGRSSIWVQLFLANKYMNEFLKDGIEDDLGLSTYDYFLLMNFRIYEDFSFYEANKYMPIDKKTLHTKINSLIEKDLIKREFNDSGASYINLTQKSRDIIKDIYLHTERGIDDFLGHDDFLELHSKVYEFNKKMRRILDLELSEDILSKIKHEYLLSQRDETEDHKKSLWVQIFLANKYMNEFLKQGFLRSHKLTPYDYFLLLSLRGFENLTFYEINKHFPIDGKTLHNKINVLVKKGFLTKNFNESGASIINLTDKTRKLICKIYLNNIEDTEEYFKPNQLLELHGLLFSFNKKIRRALDLELSDDFKNKENSDLYNVK